MKNFTKLGSKLQANQSQMARNLWVIERRFSSTDRLSGSRSERSLTSEEASIQHPLSIHSASIEHPLGVGGNQVATRSLFRIWKYAAMMALLLTLVCGNVWGADYTVTPTLISNSSITYESAAEKSGVSIQNKTLYIEVPSASSEGQVSIMCSDNQASRYAYIYKTNGTVKDNDRKIVMQKTTYPNPVYFTSSDIKTEGGKYYLVFSTTDDFKYKQIKFTLFTKAKYTTSTFYPLYASTSKTAAELISAASFHSNIDAPYTTVANANGYSSTVETPHNFKDNITSGTTYYYINPGSTSQSITLYGLSNVKSIRMYGNGTGGGRTFSVTVKKVSGTGSEFTVSSITNTNAKTIVEQKTGDLTALTGYDADTYYTYTITCTSNNAGHLWGIYVEAAAAGSGWSFRSKNSSSEWSDPIAMTEVDAGTKLTMSEEIYLPTDGVSYKVCDGDGNDETKTAETDWTYMPMGPTGTRAWTAGNHLEAANTGGAKGYVYIYSNSNDNNRYVGFIPSGYILRWGTDGGGWTSKAFTAKTSSYNEREWNTDVVTLSGSNASDKTYVAFETESGFVWNQHAETRQLIYFKPGTNWSGSDAVFSLYYWKGGSGAFAGFMTDDDGDGIYESWVPDTYTDLKFVRHNPSKAALSFDGDQKWNESGNLSLVSGKNLFTMPDDAWDGATNGTSDANWSAYSKRGRFRIDAGASEKNEKLHFIPHYFITYDANGGSGEPDEQDIAYDAASLSLTVSAGSGMTAPTGYQFAGWNPDKSSADAGTKDGNYDPGDDVTMSEDVTLYAVWTPITYTITLAQGDHGAADQSATVAYDATALTSITHVTSTGYNRTGYYDGSTKVLNADGSFVTPTVSGYITSSKWSKADDCTLTAKWEAQQYDITYRDKDDVSFSGNHMPDAPSKHTYGTATTLKKASKAGYVFNGWYTASNCASGNTNLSIGATSQTANFKLYAKWTAMSMVALADNTFYGASAMVPEGVTVGDEQYYPGVSADQRFNLVGTGTSDGSSGPMSSETISNTELDGADAVTECLYFKGAASVTSYVPSSRAIQFKVSAAGKLHVWVNNTSNIYLSNGSGETLIDATHDVLDVTAGTYYLYAKAGSTTLYGIKFVPTYTVTYNKNNGSATGTVPTDDSSPYVSGSRVTVKEPGDIALSDNIFVGWNTKSDGSGTYYSPKANFAISENTTLYARWRSTSSTTCPDGSSEGTVFALAGKDNSGGSAKNLSYGEAVDLSTYATVTNGAASLTDIRTSSGDTKATITKTKPAAVQLVGNDAMLTLYMDCELAEGDVISYTSSESVELCFTTSPTRATTISTSSKSYPIPAESPLIGTRLLYVWRATSSTVSIMELTITRPMSNHTITGAVSPAGYGSVSPASISVADGSTVSISDNVLTCDGKTLTATAAVATAEYTYTFDSWSGVADEDEITSDVTATAVFTRTANDYSLAWSTNGGSDLAGTPTSGTVAYGTTLTKPTDPTRSGYDFGGWFTNNDGTGTEAGSTMPAANTTYYAKWTQTVTLDANTDNGGDEDGSATATINGTALSSVSHATGVTGYKLTGYFTAATGGTKVLNANGTFAATSVTDYITDGKWTKSGATTLYAQWEEGCVERSLSKVVLTSTSAGTVTGYNFGEYAGDAVIGGLSGSQGAEVDDSKGGNETGYKLNAGGSAIVFATLKKGTFQEGDQVKISITRRNDTRQVDSKYNILTIYYGTNKDDVAVLTTIETDGDNDSDASSSEGAGVYTYTLTAANVTAIGSKKGIGLFRESSNGENPYVYSVEIVGCREYKTEYTVTYDGNGEDSGDEPVDIKTYEYKDQVTVLGNTGNLTKTGYTFRGWTDGTTFYRAGDKLTMKADDVTLNAVWESNSGTETVTLTYFENTNYSTSSSKPDGLSRYFYGYKSSTKTAANALTITTDGDGNVHGQNSDVEMRLNYTKKVRIYADNSTTERAATGFTGVTAISFKWKFIASGNSGKTELTSSYTVKVGATTVADAVSITGKTNDGYATVNITGIEDLDGYVEIYFGGSSASYNVYLDDIAITYAPYVDVTYGNMTGFAGTATMPGDIVGVPVGSKINRPADPTTEDDYVFGGWYKEAACSNAWDFASDKVTCNTTLYAKWIASDYSITWMVGDDEEPYSETKALAGVSLTSIPTPPADNTIGECANSFRGWSETNLYGEATSTQPTDLFFDADSAPIVSANKTFYAVFGTATTAAYAGTVLWSENWTGASNNDKPTGPTESGSVVYRNPTIEYRWECGKDSEGTDGTQSRVSTGTGGATGGSTPDALIGSKTGAGGTGGYLLVDGIPVGGAKTVTVQYVKNGNSVDVSYYLDGVYSNHNSVTSATSGSFDIDCSGKSTLSLKFEATTTNNVRLDNIVVKVKEDGATDYRCICPSLTVTPELITASTPIFITSAAGKTVRSQDSLLIVGSGLDKSATLRLSSPASKFVLMSRTNTALTTDATGAINAVGYIYYTPGEGDTSDGLDKNANFTITDGTNSVTVSQALIGRHLPANFVIAAKGLDDKWYALPANNAKGKPEPVGITVDGENDPTTATTIVANSYTLHQQTSTVISNGNGQYVKLAMNGITDGNDTPGPAPLFGGASDNELGKSGKSKVTSDLSAGNWWYFKQTNTSITNPEDAKYYMYTANTANPVTLYNDAEKWGLYASDAKNVQEIRLLTWEPSGYAITNGNPTGGTIAITDGEDPITQAIEDATVHIEAEAANGYTFTSWSVTETESGDAVTVTSATTNPTTFTMPAADVTVSATFTPNTYDITYNMNGASWAGGYSAPANYTVGTGATLPVAGDMTNTGYTFGGWYDNSSLTGSAVTNISTSDYGNKEYWAKWTENTYTITYDQNDVSATGSTAATEGHYVTVASCGFELDGYLFTGWNTANNGSGESYGAGEDIELTDDMTLYAQWATDYTITWGNVQIGGAGATVTPNLGGGNYTITANTGSWTGSLDASMISSETSGVTITNVAVSNGGSPKTITVTFAVGAEVVGESIGLTLSVPAAGVYSAKSDTKAITIDRCTGSVGGSDGVLFSAEFKDSGLGTSNICDAANSPYTFTTAELKSAATGGSIKAFTTDALNHMKFATKAISIAGSDGVIQIDLSSPLATNDLFTYYNVNSSTSAAYLRHTSPTNTTDQIALTVYNKETKVRLTSGFDGKSTLYIVRNNNDFKLHKAAVVRPAFLMLLRDDDPTSDTNLSGTNVELTTSTYLTTIQGGHAYFTSPSSGNLKIKRSSSKNYINFNSQAGYVKIVLDEALQEGDIIGFDSYNTNNLALTVTAERSTSITTTNQLYTVGSSSPLKGETTFYFWQYGGTSDYLRGLQIARSGAAGGGGGTDQITTTLSWDPALNTDPDWNSGENRLNKETGDADFTFAAVQDKNSLGALTYSSSNTGVATVTAGGTVHIVGAAGDATITATMAESGCYKGATISYNIHVVDNCDDTPGHVMAYDLGCEGTRLFVVLYDGMKAEDVSFQWYKDGVSLGEEYRAQQCTVTVAGEYYAVVDNTDAGARHCAMASDNTVVVEARDGISAEKIVDSWYVKNGRRTPDIELVQTTGATGFIVKIGETTIWNSDGTVTTGFGGCDFRLGENGIIYLNGTKDNGDAPSGLTGDGETEILKITAKGCGGDADELSITIHKQVPGLDARPSVAFVVDGTEKGRFDQPSADHSTNSPLYQFLDYGADESGMFDLTAQNIYSSVDEKAIREHFSQFDAIIITDDPSTDKKKDGKSYVNAFGTMIDVRPILTMEAFVSKLANWKAKGINGNPESPSPRQYAMTLQCKDHEIFFDIDPISPNVAHEEIDGVDYWTVTMVDKTKSPYSSKASDTDDTKGTPALQGFSASDVSGLLLLGEIKNGDKTMYTGVERQEEPAARLMLLGIQNKALPNALTTEGKTIIENAVEYLLKTNMEEVDDCSNYFIGGGGDNRWETNANWFKGKAPNSPMIRARILAPCEVSTTVHAAHIDIVTSGESSKKGGEIKGQLIIKPNGAVIVGGEVRAAEAPYFNKSDLKPTEEQDLKIETSADGQGALILNNDAGDTKATVEYFSLGRKDGGAYQFQYFASPMGYLEINPAFAGAGIYTYAWNEAVADGWERRAYYTDVLGFEGLAITTKRDYNSTYTLKGELASTADVDIPLTYTDAGAGGQNLIGNSWTAPINIASLVEAFDDDDNVVKTVNIYNSGNDEYPGLDAAGTWTEVPISVAEWPEWTGLKVIPAMQAFRIDVTSETKLTMNYEKMVRETESSSLNEPLKAPSRRSNANGASLMRIRLESGLAHTDLFLIEGGQFSEAFDNGYEAKFIAGEDNTVQFYAMNSEEKMAVLATDALEGTPVGFVPGKGTAYTISFSGDGMGYYLNDVKTQTSTLISEENTYSFEYEAGDDANRFYISATPFEAPSVTTGVTNLDAAAPKAQKIIYNDKMYIMVNGRVYSAEGQMVK